MGVAVVFTVARAVIGLSHRYVYGVVTPSQPHFYLFNTLVRGLEFLVYPIAFVSILYFLGKDLDLKRDLRVIATSLFIGCVVGNLIGHSISILQGLSWLSIHPYPRITALILLEYLLSTMVGSLYSSISSFLIGFAGLALAYLRKPRRLSNSDASSRITSARFDKCEV